MARGRGSRWLVRQWREPTLGGQLLLRPVALVFRLLAGARRVAFRAGLRRRYRLPVPVIVVGNLTVGGSGKTPLVGHLVAYLAAHGHRPGVVSRGYGGAGGAARRVGADDDPARVGDEPVLLAMRCACPVAVGADRVAAARLLLDDCDVIVADDGLQHYALARTREIAVIDGEFGLGNARVLPAGPLREPARRLRAVDWIAVRDGEWPGGRRFSVRPGRPRALATGHPGPELADWAGQAVHAVAGIGVPERFFGQLEDAGLVLERHPFRDHHRFAASDLAFGDARAILMTEKDAVKCRAFADDRMWYLPAEVVDLDGLAEAVTTSLREE